jgi:ribosomal protein S18 acetylase RimI-like enzyme
LEDALVREDLIPDLLRASCENLSGTYLALGSSTPGARCEQRDGFTVCLGAFDHPICNFATDIEATSETAGALAEIARERPTFHAYLLPNHNVASGEARMKGAGFREAYRLVMMAMPARRGKALLPLVEANEPDRRREIATFMVDQFFGNRRGGFKEYVADATAAAKALRLLMVAGRPKPVASVMLSSEGGIMGIYNLCVESSRRGQGWGSSMIETLAERARIESTGLTLQCDPQLESWYRRFGFVRMGIVRVYSFPKLGRSDILKSTT